MFHVPEQYRVTQGPLGSKPSLGNNGAFIVPSSMRTRGHEGRRLMLIVSDGLGWEHVSVHAEEKDGTERTPLWEEMSFIKDMFWGPEDVVMQLHPKKSEYVNNHPHSLHLWRPNDGSVIPTPPVKLV